MDQYAVTCGDCLDLMSSIAERSIDLVLVDPPYGTTAAAWDSVIDLSAMWLHLRRITKPRAPIVIFCSQPFTSALIMSNVDWFKWCWTWDKKTGKGALRVKYRPLQQTEDIAVFGVNGGAVTYYPQMTKRDRAVKIREHKRTELIGGESGGDYFRLSLDRYPKTILSFPHSPGGSLSHPTEKPIDLLRYLIRSHSDPGALVLDFACGSGSAGVAALLESRRFIGFEIQQKYCDIAAARLANVPVPLFDIAAAVNDTNQSMIDYGGENDDLA